MLLRLVIKCQPDGSRIPWGLSFVFWRDMGSSGKVGRTARSLAGFQGRRTGGLEFMLGDYVGAGIEKCSSLHVHACSADGKGKAPPCLTLAYLPCTCFRVAAGKAQLGDS